MPQIPVCCSARSAARCFRALAVIFFAALTSLALALLADSLRLRALLGSAGMCFSFPGCPDCPALRSIDLCISISPHRQGPFAHHAMYSAYRNAMMIWMCTLCKICVRSVILLLTTCLAYA